MSGLQEIFVERGTLRGLAGNAALRLDDPDCAGLVESGSVEVFAVPWAGGEPAGARIHLATIRAGEMLFGCRADGVSLVLLAVGVAGTRVRQLPRARLLESAQDGAMGADLACALERWTERLSAAVASQQPPRRAQVLVEGECYRGQAGTPLRANHQTIWLGGDGGCFRFLGRVEVALAAGELFPLSPSGWIVAPAEANVVAGSTLQSLADPRLWSGLERFHQAVLRSVLAAAEESAAGERHRLEGRGAAERRVAQETVDELAGVLQAESATVPGWAATDDPLLAACRLVGLRMGIAVQSPRAGRGGGDRVGAIARASGVRVRRVLLSGDWWRKDCGPLVAFAKEDGRPLALLPVSPARYEQVDPSERSRVTLDRRLAAEVQPFAYCWYRAFPPRALTVLDVVRFGLAGARGELRVILLLGLVAGVLGMLAPAATGLIVASVIPAMERQQLLLVMLALVSGAGAMSLLHLAQGIALLRIETRMDTAVEAGVWDRLLNLPTTFFRQYTAGDLALRAMGIGAIRQALTEAALSSLLTFVFSSIAFALLFYLDLRLAMVATIAFLTIVAATVAAAIAQLKYEREGSHARGKVAGLVLQLLTGVSRLRVAGAENRAGAVWAKAFSRQTRLAIQAQTVANRLAAFGAAVPLLGAAAVFATVSLGPAGDLSLAAFLAFNAAFVQVLSAAAMMGSAATSVLGVIPLYERARPILETLPEFHQAKRDPGELRGEIEVSHVAFRYQPDGPLILDDLSLHFRPGEFVALVGPSGAGKSTVLRLLLAFENPTSGSIYYDREDLAGLDHQAVRRQIGVVLQGNRLTPGDLMTNITGGSPQYTLDDAWEAARLAGLDEDIRQMPMGMFTVVSEGESTLSGGQRQRLLIARAIIDRPRILLFDEATSALDNVTQAQVSRSLENLKATRIVIAHRLSTILRADCIYVLDRGRVVQQGSYQELACRPGLFADLVRRQTL